ncbi:MULTISPECIES: hypothetical protein [Sulfurospirillum]|uniref:Transformation system protein n=3 Tax=Sulfurospirillum TaxID=57665 RepID=A0AA86DZR7_SULMK|nr:MULTISPECIES: hypothetical protein [Sulfurospirillum]AHJ12750.1 putative transformation system protein [Sulfurospirillum multivorans DSM 12446]AOO65235.1 putative transformation system protein [Sulfurospirillum halorespirans DSM 13726]QEH06245.1 putative transformation system protein [Sulfurospirillum multivorans]
MLSTVEIVELEKKVFQYRLKQRLHYLIIGSSVFLFVLVGLFFYPLVLDVFNSKEKESATATLMKNEITAMDNNLSTTTVVEANNSTAKYMPSTSNNEQKADETLTLQLPIIGKNSSDKKSSYLPEPVEKKSAFGIQEEELENRILTRKTPNTINDESFYRSKEEKIDTMLLPPPLLEEPKQKGVIKIETHEVNSIQYLKEKFEKTHSITFALMLAEEYYLAKNYNESNKWALIANNVDSENEKSWIWFAKSKIKLGHKEDAALALKAYLKNNKSQAAQSLLNQIAVGEVID